MSRVRVAAVGDVHVGTDSEAVLAPELLAETADVLLVAGDLTRHGTPAEAEIFAAEVSLVPIPVVAVLGIAGTPGFGGGFRGASCSEFGEPLMKAFVRHTRAMAGELREA